MRVLLDENFPLPLLDALLRERIDAEHIITLNQRGAADATIRARLDRDEIVLLTNDTEFLTGPVPASGWVIVSRVRQSRELDDRIEVWVRAIRSFVTITPESRVNELLDDGQLLPSHDATSGEGEEIRRTPSVVKVLGIDLASSGWVSNGSAVISFDADAQQFRTVEVAAIPWPPVGFTARALAAAIDQHARKNDIRAIALDGPQGWRDPETRQGLPGVGRRCEFECRTQGKTGVYPRTFPANQRSWIETCVEVFDELLKREGVRLADPNDSRTPPSSGYVLVECFPTSAWRSSGLAALPAKSKRPPLQQYASALASAYTLPLVADRVHSHDDLQAVVAALVAAAVIGGPAEASAHGVAARTATSLASPPSRFEGFIWNVRPPGTFRVRERDSRPKLLPMSAAAADPAIGVTQKTINAGQEQIRLKNLPGGTKKSPVTVRLELDGDEYRLVVGDAHAAWRSHQDPSSIDSFDRLFALLSDTPDAWRPVTRLPDTQ